MLVDFTSFQHALCGYFTKATNYKKMNAKSNYLVKLSDTLTNPMDKLIVIKCVTQPQISEQLQAQYTAAFTLAVVLENGEAPMLEVALALLTPTDNENHENKSYSLSSLFYWLKSMGCLALSDDNKTLRVDLSNEKLEEKWNSMESWYLDYQHHLFKGDGRELQTKIMLASLFQGFSDGRNTELQSSSSLKAGLKSINALENPMMVNTLTEFTDVLKEIIAQPGLQPSHGRIEFTLGE